MAFLNYRIINYRKRLKKKNEIYWVNCGYYINLNIFTSTHRINGEKVFLINITFSCKLDFWKTFFSFPVIAKLIFIANKKRKKSDEKKKTVFIIHSFLNKKKIPSSIMVRSSSLNCSTFSIINSSTPLLTTDNKLNSNLI